MIIDTITIEGFKSFKEREIITLKNFTAFIGSNGVGKTTVLEALCRLFSTEKSLRNINNSDFYIPVNERIDSKEERELLIEVKILFPELVTSGDDSAIPTVFRHMSIDEAGGDPYCKIRLESKWIKTTLPEGDIEQNIYWITKSVEEDEDEKKHIVNANDRSKIQLHYIPATRNPNEHLKQTSNSIMNKLLMAINWSDAIKTEIEDFSNTLKNSFQSQRSITAIQTELSSFWNEFFKSDIYSNVNISPFSKDMSQILSKTEISFTPSITGEEESMERLSDGMKSLFYFTLISTLFEIENKILNNEELDIDEEKLNPSIYNIFAIEEPENHLSPHYLGRVMKVFRKISNSNRAQVIITSHTPTIIKRVEPEEIRHIRLKENRSSTVKSLLLPEAEDEALKYVKEAVRAYPELYFSKLVVLGEGDSEELVLSKVAEAFDVLIDQSFISIVPLGGRFVNHFWKLLNQLEIPYVTLLDYDKDRGIDGGYGRIKYILKQLILSGKDRNDVLKLRDGSILSDERLEDMHNRVSDGSEINAINHLKKFDVFFSHPYDIDFIMLEKFPDAYKELNDGQRGPTIPDNDDDNYKSNTQVAIASVIKKKKATDIEAITIKDSTDYSDYYWYRYLFLGQGKPTSHLNGLSQLSDAELITNCPDVLKELIEKIKDKVAT
ncbi:AAA family ATPase [Poseidonibacter ostreae]|uniref:ATP-dependent nuclease n=1 Tax=Poseidonibacter ostreae TaxID=2654171 RepID=UPI001264FE51|nr:AAA family ATPase [Poseidonibacter ostreae]KAB7886403.1 AAA family ATPase [Poseidonibacter ostreae]